MTDYFAPVVVSNSKKTSNLRNSLLKTAKHTAIFGCRMDVEIAKVLFDHGVHVTTEEFRFLVSNAELYQNCEPNSYTDIVNNIYRRHQETKEEILGFLNMTVDFDRKNFCRVCKEFAGSSVCAKCVNLNLRSDVSR